MLLRETRRIQRRYGLSTRGSYVVQLVAESHGMDPEFIVLTEDTPTTGRLLTEALGLLLLFGAAMAAMYFGSSAIKSMFGDSSTGLAQLIPDKKEQEKYSSLLEKSMKDSGDKEDALKKLDEQLKKDGKSEEERKSILQKFMDWFKGQEEENSDEFKKVAEAWAILKDDKASEEDKKKAKAYIEEIAGASESTREKINSIDDLDEYLQKVEDIINSDELKGLNQGGEVEGAYEDFAVVHQELLDAVKNCKESGPKIEAESRRRKNLKLILEGEEEAGNEKSLLALCQKYNKAYAYLGDEHKAYFADQGIGKLEIVKPDDGSLFSKQLAWQDRPQFSTEQPKDPTDLQNMLKGYQGKADELQSHLENDEKGPEFATAFEKLADFTDEFIKDLDDQDVAGFDDTSLQDSVIRWNSKTSMLQLFLEGPDESVAQEDSSTEAKSQFLEYLKAYNDAADALSDQTKEALGAIGINKIKIDEKKFDDMIKFSSKKSSVKSIDKTTKKFNTVEEFETLRKDENFTTTLETLKKSDKTKKWAESWEVLGKLYDNISGTEEDNKGDTDDGPEVNAESIRRYNNSVKMLNLLFEETEFAANKAPKDSPTSNDSKESKGQKDLTPEEEDQIKEALKDQAGPFEKAVQNINKVFEDMEGEHKYELKRAGLGILEFNEEAFSKYFEHGKPGKSVMDSLKGGLSTAGAIGSKVWDWAKDDGVEIGGDVLKMLWDKFANPAGFVFLSVLGAEITAAGGLSLITAPFTAGGSFAVMIGALVPMIMTAQVAASAVDKNWSIFSGWNYGDVDANASEDDQAKAFAEFLAKKSMESSAPDSKTLENSIKAADVSAFEGISDDDIKAYIANNKNKTADAMKSSITWDKNFSQADADMQRKYAAYLHTAHKQVNSKDATAALSQYARQESEEKTGTNQPAGAASKPESAENSSYRRQGDLMIERWNQLAGLDRLY